MNLNVSSVNYASNVNFEGRGKNYRHDANTNRHEVMDADYIELESKKEGTPAKKKGFSNYVKNALARLGIGGSRFQYLDIEDGRAILKTSKDAPGIDAGIVEISDCDADLDLETDRTLDSDSDSDLDIEADEPRPSFDKAAAAMLDVIKTQRFSKTLKNVTLTELCQKYGLVGECDVVHDIVMKNGVVERICVINDSGGEEEYYPDSDSEGDEGYHSGDSDSSRDWE